MSKYIESYVTAQRPQGNNVETSRVSDLIPEQQRENADVLIRLLEDYYRFLNSEGLPSNILENITKEQDIDRSSLRYIDEIQKEIAKTFPNSLNFNKVSFYKRIVDYYSSRGTEDSALTFFKLFFDETVDIFYPKDTLFRLSQGNWKRKDNINLLPTVTGYTRNGYELSDNLIGTTLDFFNRPALSHPTTFYIHGADGDSHNPNGTSWNDLSGLGHDALLRGALENNYLSSEKAYEFNNGTTGEYAVIANLNYGDGKTIAEMSCFVWMRTDYDSGVTDGTFSDLNWALIDFDRSEVFNLYINGDGFLAFSGDTSNFGGIGTNMVNGSSSQFDIAANGRAAGDTLGAVDTSLKVNDGNYHYVGVTYSVANQRIILWIDGVAKFVATGNGNLGALAAGAKRFGVIGDGSEAGTGTDENDYNNPALNGRWFDGAISAIHLHEAEVCSNDVTIAIDDTNTNVTANKNATTVSTYPAKQIGRLSSLDFISQEVIQTNYSGGLHPNQSLDNSLKLYYDFGIEDSYQDGTSVLNDISNYGEVDANIVCNYCTQTSNSLKFNPSQATYPTHVQDNINTNGLSNQLIPPVDEYTFVSWIKKDDFVNTNFAGEISGESYSTVYSYKDSNGDNWSHLLIRQSDGAIGRFRPIPLNQFGTDPNGNLIYPADGALGNPYVTALTEAYASHTFHSDFGSFTTANKITDSGWHMVAIRHNATGNGSIDISLDGNTWENIFTGSTSGDGDFFKFVSGEGDKYLSIGNIVSSTGLNFLPAVVEQYLEEYTANPNYNTSLTNNTNTSYLPFSGEINSFYSYDKQLTQSEVTNLYTKTKSLVENGIIQGDNRFVYEIGYTGVNHADVSSNTEYIEFEDLLGIPRLVNLTFDEKDDIITGGKYLDKQSFASNINKLQDSNYWQEFSYEIQSGITSGKWINEFNNLVHPAGMKLFAALILKIFKDNTWDDHYIIDYYDLKKRLEEEQNLEQKALIQQSIDNLEKEINSLYRLTGQSQNYKNDFSWIRDTKIDARNPSGYGSPTYQPGYLYKDFAILTFLIEAFLTPTDNAVTEEEQYWINVGKNYFAHIVLAFISESSENIDERMYSQYALGQLKFIAEHRPMSQYGSYRLDQGATEEALDPEQPLKFTALNSRIEGFGVNDIFPYVRGFFTGAASSVPNANNNYDLSSRDELTTVERNTDTHSIILKPSNSPGDPIVTYIETVGANPQESSFIGDHGNGIQGVLGFDLTGTSVNKWELVIDDDGDETVYTATTTGGDYPWEKSYSGAGIITFIRIYDNSSIDPERTNLGIL